MEKHAMHAMNDIARLLTDVVDRNLPQSEFEELADLLQQTIGEHGFTSFTVHGMLCSTKKYKRR